MKENVRLNALIEKDDEQREGLEKGVKEVHEQGEEELKDRVRQLER
ncbi:hypothetical protein [Wolbachia endosymbiont of Ctenocephalides felis wCfeT]|nr:hypothetical protein [Wolbachia endosymbiont of Ctenocephalides felis wCfeT]